MRAPSVDQGDVTMSPSPCLQATETLLAQAPGCGHWLLVTPGLMQTSSDDGTGSEGMFFHFTLSNSIKESDRLCFHFKASNDVKVSYRLCFHVKISDEKLWKRNCCRHTTINEI